MHVIQSVIPAYEGFPSDLYLRVAKGKRKRAIAHGVNEPLAVELAKDETLSTNTFFNSFYRSYWTKWTNVERISVSAEIQGKGRISISEEGDNGIFEIAGYEFDEADSTSVLFEVPKEIDTPLGLKSESDASRIFIEITAASDCRIGPISFVTDAAPVRHPRLSIGLCTFNQEKRLADTLGRLQRLSATDPDIETIIVVNQGDEFSDTDLLQRLQDPKTNVIEQPNLGGAGGFTRTLVETMTAAETATHHLLMDDDIVLDERLVSRAMRFQSHCRDDIAVGAGMLDLLRPNVLYEFASTMSRENRIVQGVHNLDVSDSDNLDRFGRPHPADYNAWWFCMFPKSAIDAVGLPLPVFIRGDDIEYGYRLSKAGIETVALPGIGVWHEPFYVKPFGWQTYYDFRNQLIFGALYKESVNTISVMHAGGRVFGAILTHNYGAANLLLLAIEDFLKGPEKVFVENSVATHSKVMATAASHKPTIIASNEGRNLEVHRGEPRATTVTGLLAQYLGSFIQTTFAPIKQKSEILLMDVGAHPANTGGRSYIVTNGLRSYYLRFSPNSQQLFSQSWRAAKLLLRYRRKSAEASLAWARSSSDFNDVESWNRRFANDGGEVS